MYANKECTCCSSERCKYEQGSKYKAQLKCCWRINPHCSERVIFTAPAHCGITAFGTIKFNCQSSISTNTVCINVYEGDRTYGKLIDSFLLDEDSCVPFVLKDFNTITVSSLKNKEAHGEICITSIF